MMIVYLIGKKRHGTSQNDETKENLCANLSLQVQLNSFCLFWFITIEVLAVLMLVKPSRIFSKIFIFRVVIQAVLLEISFIKKPLFIRASANQLSRKPDKKAILTTLYTNKNSYPPV